MLLSNPLKPVKVVVQQSHLVEVLVDRILVNLMAVKKVKALLLINPLNPLILPLLMTINNQI